MTNHDGYNSSEIMYPAVTTQGGPQHQLMPATPYVAPSGTPLGGPAQRGPELLNGAFNQTWLLNCLRRRWLRALLMGGLLGTIVAILLLVLFPLSSSVTALVHVQQEHSDFMDENRSFSPQKVELFQETQASLIKSQFILKTALMNREISQLDAVHKEEPDPVTWLQEELQVGFQGENLFIRFDGQEDSEEMKKVVGAVIEAYEKEVVNDNIIRSQEMYEKLTQLQKELSKELRDKIEKYETLSAEIGGAESAIANSVLNMLINEVRQIQSEIMKKKGEMVEIEVNKKIHEQQLTSKSMIEQAVAEELEKDQMLESYKAEEFAISQQIRMQKSISRQGSSAQIKRLENSLVQLQQASAQYRQQAEKEIRDAIRRMPNDALAAVMTEYILRRDNITAEIAKLEAEYEEKVEEIESKGIRNGELTMLEAEIEQLREIETEMSYKLRNWSIQDKASNELFRVLQDPIATEKINTLQRFALAGLGGLATFCATCYGIALIEFRRRRLNGASDIDEGLGLRVLGVLPAVSSRKSMAPGSMLAAQLSESIDNVRATLMHDSTNTKRQVVIVTSPATMEGTTTVSSHLALSLARAGKKTLLIDGDIREPALHKLFGMPLDEGLCEVLRSDVDLADVIRPTSTESLWLLTAGHCDLEATQALATEQPQPIFEKLRAEFDFIVIDGAPVLGLSDSISLGQHVDGAILTVLRDHSEVRKIYQAIELLKDMGIRLIGSVVNGVPLKADRRIAQLHKNAAKNPRKLEAASNSKPVKKAKKAKTPAKAKVEEPTASVDTLVEDAPNHESVEEFNANFDADLADIELKDEVELDFDDLGLDDDKRS